MPTLSATRFPRLAFPHVESRLPIRLDALLAILLNGVRRWRARSEARRAAEAFERLDDRLLRDLGFHRAHAGSSLADHGARRSALYHAM